ncbi:MAG: hypothetical protein ACLSAF_13130 [Intestinimonas sp.]
MLYPPRQCVQPVYHRPSLCPPLLEGDSDILLTTPLESGGYVDMTLDVLERFGVRAVPSGSCAFHVPGGQTYRPHDMAIESDYSQAAFWYAARGLGSQVELQGLNPFSVQGIGASWRIPPACAARERWSWTYPSAPTLSPRWRSRPPCVRDRPPAS